jgi:hypothetical protein
VVRDADDDVKGETGRDHAEVQGEHEAHGARLCPNSGGYLRAKVRRRRSRSSTKGSSPSRRGGRRSGDSPTRDKLYEQAKQLGIEGRSKMNKQQLARAVGRKAT